MPEPIDEYQTGAEIVSQTFDNRFVKKALENR